MPADIDTVGQLEKIAFPLIRPRDQDPDVEIFRLGSVGVQEIIAVASVARENQDDLVFTEGRRTRVTHLRVERSPKLRRLFFASLNTPFLCDMCDCDMNLRYPWSDNLLEIHHLLPLASVIRTIRTTQQGTSFNDLVPLCPNCHKGVHAFYRLWLRQQAQEDFLSEREAKEVYREAKQQVVMA